MVLLNKNRLLYYKQKVSGAGVVQRQIVGNGIFKDSLKTLGKYALFGSKNLWKNALKPKAIMLAMESVVHLKLWYIITCISWIKWCNYFSIPIFLKFFNFFILLKITFPYFYQFMLFLYFITYL
jgi:hypothetical protein